MAIHEHMPRRGILKGALVAPFAVGAASAYAATPDPLPGLLAYCEHCRAVWLATSEHTGEDSPEDKTAWEAFMEAEKAVETTVASTPEGVAAQIRYLKESYRPGMELEAHPAVHDVPFRVLDVILEGLGRIGQ